MSRIANARSTYVRGVTALGALAAIAFAGCYAQTDPATKVGPESATLNARGTANNGPARSHFEYWIVGSSRVRTTSELRWPAGASGPFSQQVTGLAASTAYSFRICGADDPNGQNVCAQTRSFTTTAPFQDSAVGSWANSPFFNGDVNAHSSPSGQDARGTLRTQVPAEAFSGSVTCLRANGNRAAVGAVGQATDHDLQTSPATLVVTIVDGGAGGDDAVHVNPSQPGSAPPSCASASFGQETSVVGELVVNDAR